MNVKLPKLPLIHRIHEFFVRNPDEELTSSDMAVKFDSKPATCLALAKELGLQVRPDPAPRQTTGRRMFIVSAWPEAVTKAMINARQAELLEEAIS